MLEYLALSIGARSQTARTYLERHLSEFADCDVEALIQHGLKALRETLQQDKDLTVDNTSIVRLQRCSKNVSFTHLQGVISPTSFSSLATDSPFKTGSILSVSHSTLPPFGQHKGFKILEGQDLKPYLDKLEPKEKAPKQEESTETTQEQPAPMEVD